MAKIYNALIKVSAIPKDKIISKNKEGNSFKDGASFIDVQIFLNDEPDQYGNELSISINQTKEERERKEKRNYIGNGKKVWESSNKMPWD